MNSGYEQHKQCRDAWQDVPSVPCLCTLLTIVAASQNCDGGSMQFETLHELV